KDYSTFFGASITVSTESSFPRKSYEFAIWRIIFQTKAHLLGAALLAGCLLYGHAVFFNWRRNLVAALMATVRILLFHSSSSWFQVLAHGHYFTGGAPEQEAGDDVMPLPRVIYGLFYLLYVGVMA
ncbi:hypothetical protein PMAYCL1PPCAC_05192, partial [Pristionchus mayeri]